MTSEEVQTKNLRLRLGAVVIIGAITSGLLVYGYISEATWAGTFRALISGIFGG